MPTIIIKHPYTAIYNVTTWYPDWAFYCETHNRMLHEFGGYEGYTLYAQDTFNAIISEAQKMEDLYDQAATLICKLRTIRLVEDAQKRTAYTVTATFLEKNGGEMHERDIERVNTFMKQGILKYDLEQIVEWLKHGAES
jgi:prophage maintenance system killer protein